MSERTPTKSPTRRRSAPTRIAGHQLLRPLEGSHATWEVPSDDPKRIELLVLGRARKGEQPEVRTAFDRRLRARASLRHPHLASVIDGGESPRGPYVVVSLPRSQPLSALVAEGPLDGARTYNLLTGVADALDAAHARWLIHTDLTPRAVFVEPGGSDWAYLTDFGIVHNRAPLAFARAGYRSPEELRGESPVPESNVYSLACIVFTCLAGTAPFGRKSSRAAVQAQLHEPPPRLTEARPDLPKLVDIVLNSALSENPEERPKSAGALMQEVGQALGVIERPTDGSARSGRFRRRPADVPADDGFWSTRSSATATTTDARRRTRTANAAVAAPAAHRPSSRPGRTAGHRPGSAARTQHAARSRTVLVPAESRAKRRGAPPLVLGAVLIAAIAGAGIAGWAVGGADTKAKPDPSAVAAQRSAAAKARTAAAQERERVAWLGSANNSIARLDTRRGRLPAQPRAGHDPRRAGRGRPPAGRVLRGRAGPGADRPGPRDRCRGPRCRPAAGRERLHAAGHRRTQRQPLGLSPGRRLGAPGGGRCGLRPEAARPAPRLSR